jgi:hypothetical protein
MDQLEDKQEHQKIPPKRRRHADAGRNQALKKPFFIKTRGTRGKERKRTGRLSNPDAPGAAMLENRLDDLPFLPHTTAILRGTGSPAGLNDG